MSDNWERHEVKSVKQIMAEHPTLDWSVHDFEVLCDEWVINDAMIHKFGDCYTYRFLNIKDEPIGSYTHRSEEGYYYHESWFVDHKCLNLLPEELFEI